VGLSRDNVPSTVGVTEIIERSIGEVKGGRFRSTVMSEWIATDGVNGPLSRMSKARLLLACDFYRR